MHPFEALASSAFWLGRGSNGHIEIVLLMLALNAAFSLAATAGALAVTPSLRQRKRRGILLVFALFGTVIPGFGLLLPLLMLLALPRLGNKYARMRPRLSTPPPFAPEIRVKAARFGVAGASERLRQPAGRITNTDTAMHALLAIERHHGAQDVSLLRATMRHRDEHLRLLAYNSLDRRETTINHTIQRLHETLKNSSQATAPHLHKELAILYFELIYQGLAHEGLVHHRLKQCQHHIDRAQKSLTDDPRLLTLAARLRLRQNDYSGARSLFEKAEVAGALNSRIAAYQAELAWQRRDYTTMRRLLGSDFLLGKLPTIGPVAQRWQRRSDG